MPSMTSCRYRPRRRPSMAAKEGGWGQAYQERCPPDGGRLAGLRLDGSDQPDIE